MIAVTGRDGRSVSTRAATSIAAPIRRRSEQGKLSLTIVRWLVDRSTGWIDRFAPCLRQRTSCRRYGAFLSLPRADRPTLEDDRGCSSIIRWTRDRDGRVRLEPSDRRRCARRGSTPRAQAREEGSDDAPSRHLRHPGNDRRDAGRHGLTVRLDDGSAGGRKVERPRSIVSPAGSLQHHEGKQGNQLVGDSGASMSDGAQGGNDRLNDHGGLRQHLGRHVLHALQRAAGMTISRAARATTVCLAIRLPCSAAPRAVTTCRSMGAATTGSTATPTLRRATSPTSRAEPAASSLPKAAARTRSSASRTTAT